MRGLESYSLYFVVTGWIVTLSSGQQNTSNGRPYPREPKFMFNESDRRTNQVASNQSEPAPYLYHFYCSNETSQPSNKTLAVTSRKQLQALISNTSLPKSITTVSKKSFWKKKLTSLSSKPLHKPSSSWTREGRLKEFTTSTTSSSVAKSSTQVFQNLSQRISKNDSVAVTLAPSPITYYNSSAKGENTHTTDENLPEEPIVNYDVYEGVLLPSPRQRLHEQTNASRVHSCSTKVVGYYTSWGTHIVTRTMLSYLTHVMYAFPDVSSTGSISVSPESAERLQQLLTLRGNENHPKISLSIGGANARDIFSQIIHNTTVFQTFTGDLLEFIQKYRLDGVDIDWEYPNATEKYLFLKLMKDIRSKLDEWKGTLKRDERLLLSFAGPAGFENLDTGFDIAALLTGDTIDFVNVMTYDFFGPWPSPSGKNTGPIAPLFCAAPANYSRKLNTHWTIEQYVCRSKAPHKIVLGVPFYGRYWNNVGQSVDGNPMWRVVNGDDIQGGHSSYREIASQYTWNKNYAFYYNDTAKAAFAWNNQEKTYLGYESSKCVDMKAQYVIQNKLGGVMIWAIDFDDDNHTLIKALTNYGNMCKTRPMSLKKTQYNCYEKRWWTYSDDPAKSGMCGKLAPLFNGTYYPVCDPEDLPYSCCGRWGYCGSGHDFCSCPGCVDFGSNPERLKSYSVKPTTKEVLWHTLEAPPGSLGRCGPTAPRLNSTTINSTIAICNPDVYFGFCCSTAGYCGVGEEFCKCTGCVDFSKNPDYRYTETPIPETVRPGEKRWWTWDDGEEKSGKCGPDTPKINGTVEAICDPTSLTAHCCSAFGFCGSSPAHCVCPTCRNYSISV